MSLELEDRGKALEDEYFFRQEKELLAKMKAKLEGEGSSESKHDCPKCDGKLKEINYEKVKIDACEKCAGVWLDAGELAQIIGKDSGETGWFSRFLG
jgi:uncharacterized protein